ncbi:MAG: ABC transporter permease [Acidimicrobiales bacterium]|nr:ABC transporter permease [Acidimicrobiaceae bacterium]MBT5207226.1 ABC transporter permease [Acidimicrobiaceae bacterium]MBT5568896.1 ABC transporter permease [Acidimicrobiaceae bacterium]MBT6093189.1 ABC transporter permease [Acidimicrobiaceae bacterium]MDG2161124.1 ABC transporter permease [Acidimicrobiales bacterium]
MTEASLIGLLEATVSFGALLYLAALGEMISEKAGILNLGVEGMMAIGAVTGFVVALQTGNPWVALVAAIAAGALIGLLHGLFTVVLGAEQVVSGLSLTILGIGLAAYIGKGSVGQPAGAELVPVDWGPLSDIPWVGPVLFQQSPLVYMAVLAGLAASFVLGRTRLGLAVRAAGESAPTADAAGHSVAGLRLAAVATGGALAGASGAYLTLSITPQWTEGVVAGRGWIAVALVIFGAWRPGRVALGALLFGLTLALKTRLQTFGVDFSPILLSMLPYLLTVGVLVAISIRSRNRPSPAPAALGIAYRREER